MPFHVLQYFLNTIQKIAALCLVMFLFTTPAYASWTIQNSGVSNDLFAVDFPVNENTGFAVGTSGTILKTTDAGNSWKKMKSGVRNNLTDVAFINDQVGYATGVNGTILKTTNGGTSWSKLNSGTSQHLLTVHFPVDANTGYVGGNASTLLKTTNGGQTWTPLTIDGGYVYDIVFPQNASTGYVAAIYGSLGYIYKTTDGGLNWVRVLDLEDAFIQSMSFPLDDQTGYVANYATYTQPGGIWKTTDGGATWNFMTQGITSVPVAIDFPVDAQFGLAVGYAGAIIKTTDGGITWSEGSLAVSNTMEDVDLLNNHVGYAVGRGGLIAKTSDGGNPPIVSLYLHPTASGRINTFTFITGCSTDWDCVNDQSGNLGSGLPQTVNIAGYIADGSGNRAMFALDNGVISSNQTVTKICVSTAVTQETGPYASLSYQRVGIDPAPVDTLPFWMGNYWVTGIQTWCWSNLNWTSTDLDALEIGVKTVNGEWLEVSQLYTRVYTTAP